MQAEHCFALKTVLGGFVTRGAGKQLRCELVLPRGPGTTAAKRCACTLIDAEQEVVEVFRLTPHPALTIIAL
jgi:hypothetical protein